MSENVDRKNSSSDASRKFLSLGQIIEKVIIWRSLCYEGGNEEKNRNLLSKEYAAKRVNLKKKSLDDYQLFLKLGITMGYDFKTNLQKSFNYLRKFIKSKGKRVHWDKFLHPDIESLEQIIEVEPSKETNK